MEKNRNDHKKGHTVGTLPCCFFTAIYCVGYSQQTAKEAKFFRYDLLATADFLAERFDLGEVRAGDHVKVQLFLRNHTKDIVRVAPAPTSSDARMDSNQVLIAPKDGQLIFATIKIPSNPKSLDQEIVLEFLLNKTDRFFCSFKPRIVDVATFQDTAFQHEFTDRTSRVCFSVPLLLSDIGDIRRIKVICNEPLEFLTTKIKEQNGAPIIDISFDPSDVKRHRLSGVISLKREGVEESSSLKLTVVHSNVLELYPERIILKPNFDQSTYVGEAIVKCKNSSVDISSLTVRCEADNGEIFGCRLEKMSVSIGRIYVTLHRENNSAKNSDFDLLFDVAGFEKEWQVFAKARIAN